MRVNGDEISDCVYDFFLNEDVRIHDRGNNI